MYESTHEFAQKPNHTGFMSQTDYYTDITFYDRDFTRFILNAY